MSFCTYLHFFIQDEKFSWFKYECLVIVFPFFFVTKTAMCTPEINHIEKII